MDVDSISQKLEMRANLLIGLSHFKWVVPLISDRFNQAVVFSTANEVSLCQNIESVLTQDCNTKIQKYTVSEKILSRPTHVSANPDS